MHLLRRHLPCLLLAALSCTVGSASDLLVVCAPGYPGTTEDAQPTMDSLASLLVRAAGAQEGELEARYFNEVEACRQALGLEETVLVLATSPFLHTEAGDDLASVGRVIARAPEGSDGLERWSLVAARGALSTLADLSGWTLEGIPGYAPDFVRTLLASWGEVPADLTISYEPRVLSALRRASRGDQVAVLLDRDQAAALPRLPFADALEVVTTFPPRAGQVIAVPASRGDSSAAGRWLAALESLDEREDAREILATMKVERFEAPAP